MEKNDKIDHICEMVLFIFSFAKSFFSLLLCKHSCCFIECINSNDSDSRSKPVGLPVYIKDVLTQLEAIL